MFKTVQRIGTFGAIKILIKDIATILKRPDKF